ncbi:MAG: glycine cleavage system aminomethyltransferase GcvT [Eubacteriales bacterium]|nr:glycine cleavage system aminomethyltransferase GcvT [Eubacteriales bacterium]MDD4327831.1 glycine cleavage system aminomethyltransferase GcvT [Eubacteriales bacterium]MDD4717207.1 glycine cleavage system aminomethyltransferase GcvT [Eubacteriales bacterium]NCU26326.1 glycine cleavage system aminomethyltransferase GcvT [Candidatus Nomurabacteria bacterium]
MEINSGNELKTPLYDIHIASGGKMVPFAGHLLPVRYESGIIAEHNAVRTAAGSFDVSHMGEIILDGTGAFDTIQNVLTNDFTGLADGGMRYSPMCNNEGGVIDDVIVYRFSADKYMIVVNASNKDKDYAWISSHLSDGTECRDLSPLTAQIALQGPESEVILRAAAGSEADLPVKAYTFTDGVVVAGIECLVSASGYTGEAGYEIYMPPEGVAVVWNALIDSGRDFGLIPCGLGARDTLRLEASMPLYGHELNEDITPFEASLGRYVKMDKPDFIGKGALEGKTEPERIRVGIEVTDKGIAREDCQVFSGDVVIGKTTSGTMCPYIGKAVAMAIIDREFADPGTQLEIDVRGRKLKAVTVKMPFYKKEK